MKMKDAMEIIGRRESKPPGFMVLFEVKEGVMLRGDYFPDKTAGEPLIETEEEAWELARKFAEKTVGRCMNIYVVDSVFLPVPGYQDKKIPNCR